MLSKEIINHSIIPFLIVDATYIEDEASEELGQSRLRAKGGAGEGERATDLRSDEDGSEELADTSSDASLSKSERLGRDRGRERVGNICSNVKEKRSARPKGVGRG